MSSIEVDIEELNDVTLEILNRTSNMKVQIKNDMVIGERDILKGISIFEEIVEVINPSVMNDEMELLIKKTIDEYMIEVEDRHQHINGYVHLGIDRCYMMLNNYNRYVNGIKYMKKIK